MPTDPRPRRKGTADEAAALAFATAESRASAPEAPATHGQTTDAPAHDLSAAREERIRRVLDFEAGWSSHGGAKARAIRAEFGWTPTRYYQALDGLLETQEAVRHDPMLVRRLLRLREGR
ncbi:DUF3263 domain-containing protein [Agrococcus sp. ARC_14]|uniref:DUF3263 domain-containing protein n=1 Tax=Agrococcus sp. ARC_14 TaxID=2919927 RepID=UPI001F05C9F9|nr:DUF3263 domain-containing protein [Agrococcus sp. ARC_14]MCH1884362.1 DUF3263 domain-containing protein [Agrococcus sp. ARC_14]